MITFGIRMERYFYHDISVSNVTTYLEELTAFKEKINNISGDYEYRLFGSGELIRQINDAIDNEVSYCNFYLDYLNRMQEKNFNQWVFTKKEDVPDLYGWRKATCDQWTKTNGRIKATIELDAGKSMTKISLSFKNDSGHLVFYERNRDEFAPSHAKNPDSINMRIAFFKKYADDYLLTHQHPHTRDFYTTQQLNELLHITSTLEGEKQ